MAGLLDYIRRVAPGDAPVDPMAGSVMSPDYIPQTSPRQLALGGLRGLLDVSPVGMLDAAANAINRANLPSLVALRTVMGKQQEPGAAMVGLLGQGSGPGYDAARSATQAVVPMLGLLGNQASGTLPAGYARDQSGAIVWHGSPHKFDKFDASKIGTGEGNQAYGYGLYFADRPGVADSYRPEVSEMNLRYADDAARAAANKMMPWGFQDPIAVVKSALGAQGDTAAAIKYLRSGWPKDADRQAHANHLADLLEQGAIRVVRPERAGALYKVDLPDEAIAKMLDWDKPLSQQSETVKQLLPKLSEWQKSMLNDPQFRAAWKNKFDNAQTGGVTYGELSRERGGAAATADYLSQLGIPGIRYLDGGSRGAGSGTSNYVVFPGNEGLLKILDRQ